MLKKVIIIGGGLSGLSAAHTVIENGGSVIVLEKNSFCGGNSTKATSGISGALSVPQAQNGIKDSLETFKKDVALSASGGKSTEIYPLGNVLCSESISCLNWLSNKFNIDLSLVGHLGGHSFPRVHRGKERFPGMTITYGLLEALEKIEKDTNGETAKIITKAKATKLITENGNVIGVEYIRNNKSYTEYGAVIIATGGYSADGGSNSLLAKYRPDLMNLPTTNAPQTTGDGIKMVLDIGGDVVDMECVQVHPTSLVQKSNPNAKTKFLAAEALRGAGGIMLDANGNRFCDELGRRDYVSGEMQKNKQPFHLILNSKSSNEIIWHCKHYEQRKLMTYCRNGNEVAKEIGISPSKLKETFDKYNQQAIANKDEFNKRFFKNTPYEMNDTFYVAQVCPAVHYTMGGLKVSVNAEVMKDDKPIPGLFATGEVLGGVHGLNRLGGNSLLDCVVFGRVSGRTAVKYILHSALNEKKYVALNRIKLISNQLSAKALRKIPMSEVAKHNKENDCWVVLYDKVYDLTSFLEEHPGGKDSVMLYAGKDATEAFDMIHEESVLDKYTPDAKIGELEK
jgi:flavocytochrome c